MIGRPVTKSLEKMLLEAIDVPQLITREQFNQKLHNSNIRIDPWYVRGGFLWLRKTPRPWITYEAADPNGEIGWTVRLANVFYDNLEPDGSSQTTVRFYLLPSLKIVQVHDASPEEELEIRTAWDTCVNSFQVERMATLPIVLRSVDEELPLYLLELLELTRPEGGFYLSLLTPGDWAALTELATKIGNFKEVGKLYRPTTEFERLFASAEA